MVNQMILQGRLTRDVELRRTQSGTAVCSFTIAWSQKFKDNEQKLFMPCVAWRGTAEFASKYFEKGQEVIAEGYLTSRKWQDKNGNDRETIELNVDKLHFCGPKKDGYASSDSPPGDFAEQPQEFAEIDEEDGELPF